MADIWAYTDTWRSGSGQPLHSGVHADCEMKTVDVGVEETRPGMRVCMGTGGARVAERLADGDTWPVELGGLVWRLADGLFFLGP